jgi:hypothetical protein
MTGGVREHNHDRATKKGLWGWPIADQPGLRPPREGDD